MNITGRYIEKLPSPDFCKDVVTIEIEPPTDIELANLKIGDKVLVEVEIKEIGTGRLKGTFKDIYDTDFMFAEIEVIGKDEKDFEKSR